MKRFFSILILMGLGVILGFSYREIRGQILARKERAQSLKTVYATHPVLKNCPFVVVVSGYNNRATCEQTLLSILNQDYDNFRLIYIDDGSSDGSYERIEAFLKDHPLRERVELVHSGEHRGSVEGLYRAFHTCKSCDIVLLLEGGEFLAHENVLSRLNHYYANSDVWLTEGVALNYPSYERGKGGPRLRSFYAGLVQHVGLKTFLKGGEFLPGSVEGIIGRSLEDLSGKHTFLTPDVFYISGAHREIVKGKEGGGSGYPPFRNIPTHDFIQDDEYVDIVVFSYNRPLQLYAFLESAETYIQSLHRLYVIYRADNDHYQGGYLQVKKDFPNVIYIKQSFEPPHSDFAALVQKTIFDRQMSTTRYVAFALDDNIVRDRIDMKEVVSLMKRTGAYGFYFCLGEHIEENPTQAIPIKEGVFAWQFCSGVGEWVRPNSVNMALFRKEKIYPHFMCMKFYNPSILQALWNKHADLSGIGLCYSRSKVVKLSFDRLDKRCSPGDLLTLFDQGLKIDTKPLNQLENREVEIRYEPCFIKR